jgi:hypothetical protein
VGYQDNGFDQGQQGYDDPSYEQLVHTQNGTPRYGGAPPTSQPPPAQYALVPVERTKEQTIAAISLILMGLFPLIQFAYIQTYSYWDTLCFIVYMFVGIPPILVGIMVFMGRTGLWVVGIVWAVFAILWSLTLILSLIVAAAMFGGIGDSAEGFFIILSSLLPMVFAFLSIFFLLAVNRKKREALMASSYGQPPPMYQARPPGY